MERELAVLFDMDGVIVDSMPYHFISWYEALRPLGIRVSCLFVYEKEGERWEKTIRELLRLSGKRLSPRLISKVFEDKQRIFRKYFRRFIFEGVEDVLSSLKKEGFRLGLVTSTPMKEVRLILPRGISAFFDAVVSGDMVGKGKPHPDPYLKAASLLGLGPKDCLVVENAMLGIRSARSAGMYCCALTTSLPAGYLKESDTVVDSLAEITGIARGFREVRSGGDLRKTPGRGKIKGG